MTRFDYSPEEARAYEAGVIAGWQIGCEVGAKRERVHARLCAYYVLRVYAARIRDIEASPSLAPAAAALRTHVRAAIRLSREPQPAGPRG